MKHALFLLLSGLNSCQHAAPANSQHPTTQADPLLGHWQCDSVASVHLDSTGRAQGEPRLEGVNFALDITPTQLAITVGVLPGDTAFATYTRHGKELITTSTQTNREPTASSEKVEHVQIVTLTPTVFRMEKTFPLQAGASRFRYFYHR
jgi:hypothetical protein